MSQSKQLDRFGSSAAVDAEGGTDAALASDGGTAVVTEVGIMVVDAEK